MEPYKTQNPRNLTEDDIKKLEKQNDRLVSTFQANNLEINARKFWDQFYKRNKTNFFKDRHWTSREFQELVNNDLLGDKVLLEVGCGVGNLIFPLLAEETTLKIIACDFSDRAVQFVKDHPDFDSEKITAFQADITSSDFCRDLHAHTDSVDIISMVFVLSAIHPNNFVKTLKNMYDVLRFGGVIVFRDYGINDMTQVRFKAGHKIGDNLYMRQDGTRSYFFTLEQVKEVFTEAGFVEVECYYVHNRTINVKEHVDVPRTYVQAKFKKNK